MFIVPRASVVGLVMLLLIELVLKLDDDSLRDFFGSGLFLFLLKLNFAHFTILGNTSVRKYVI